MKADGTALAAAAEQLAGTPFCWHGRDPATGLDCVGLVGAAMAAIGRVAELPAGYGPRQREASGHEHGAEYHEASGPVRAGDVLLVRCGPLQHHLVIASAEGRFIHAHAGLGRVVISPPPLPWPVLRRWRINDR